MAGSVSKRVDTYRDGSGQLRDRPPSWRARYKAPDGRWRSRSFRRKIDAGRWLAEQVAAVDRGNWLDPRSGRVTVADWATGWLDGLHVKPKTYAGYQSLLRSRVLPMFGALELRQVAPADVRGWVAAMVSENLAPATVARARQVLHALMGQAVSDGLIRRNPAAGVKSPRVEPRRQRYLTGEELAGLADAADAIRPGSGALVSFLGWSGLRWGEAVALRVGSLDVARRRVTVAESATEIAGRLTFGTPKTHETRTVIVPGQVVADLVVLIDGRAPDALVFVSPEGGPLRLSNWRRRVWAPAVTAAGAPADLTLHDLRDTAAALMISSGASVKAVQRALGHKSAAMTLDVYGGLYVDDLEDLADRLEARYAASRVPRVSRGGDRMATVTRIPL
ncbi:site-specific integrase [soil metagenome]